MSAIDTILVATDLSPESAGAVEYAAGLAAATGARVELAHVLNGHVMMPSELLRRPSACELAASATHAVAALHRMATHVGHRHVSVECVVLHGDPRDEIPRLAERLHPQLIVMAQARCFLGSIVETVMRDVNIPLLVAPRVNRPRPSDNKGEGKCESPTS